MSERVLWTPGDPLELPLTSPDPAALRAEFSQHVMPGSNIFSIDHSLSALVQPRYPIRGFAFLDIDDTFADLSGSLQGLYYGEPVPATKRMNNHDYGEGLFFDDSDFALKKQLIHLLRGSESGLRVADEVDEISTTIASWRAAGIYTGFLSAQAAGSELSTINGFIGRYFRNNCDFIVVPNGHYSVANKGAAARAVIETVGSRQYMPVVAIDDWPAHTAKVRAALSAHDPNLATLTIQYDFPSHVPPDTDSAHAITPHEACDIATEFFTRALGRTTLTTDAI